jgi:acyl dehydratase
MANGDECDSVDQPLKTGPARSASLDEFGDILTRDDYDIERVKSEWIGVVVDRSEGRYPVEYDPIRRYCNMIHDLNPLFLDPEVARGGPYGEVIVPGPLLPYFAGGGPWPRKPKPGGRRPGWTYGVPTPGDRGINLEVAWEYHHPVRVGDRLSSETRIADVFVKPIKIDPTAVCIVTEQRFIDQGEQCVASCRNSLLVHRSKRQIAAEESTGHSRNG